MKHELHDHNCQSNNIFIACMHPMLECVWYAKTLVELWKVIICNFVKDFTILLDQECSRNDDMIVKLVFVPNNIVANTLDARCSRNQGFKNHNNQRRKTLEWIMIKDFFQNSQKVDKMLVMDKKIHIHIKNCS